MIIVVEVSGNSGAYESEVIDVGGGFGSIQK